MDTTPPPALTNTACEVVEAPNVSVLAAPPLRLQLVNVFVVPLVNLTVLVLSETSDIESKVLLPANVTAVAPSSVTVPYDSPPPENVRTLVGDIVAFILITAVPLLKVRLVVLLAFHIVVPVLSVVHVPDPIDKVLVEVPDITTAPKFMSYTSASNVPEAKVNEEVVLVPAVLHTPLAVYVPVIASTRKFVQFEPDI